MRDIRIDILRGLAIIAVVIDHSFDWAYTNVFIHNITFFSVTLFVFCGGITAAVSMKRDNIESKGSAYITKYVIMKEIKILIPYAVATGVCSFIDKGYYFDSKYWCEKVFSFTGAPQYYYLVFYLQLLIVSPLLYKIIRFIKRRSSITKFILNAILLFSIFEICVWCTDKTSILKPDGNPYYGGAAYLLGGSYFFVFTLGMLFYEYYETISCVLPKWFRLVSFIVCIFYTVMMGNATKLIVELIPKWGVNPPGIRYIIWVLLIVAVVYLWYPVMSKNNILSPWHNFLATCGKFSLYIFLYHLYSLIILRNTIFVWYPMAERNVLLRFVLIGVYGIVIPVVVACLYKMISEKTRGASVVD